MNLQNHDTSVTFSLAELAKLEEERVREEDSRVRRTREREAREARETEARRRAAEAAEIAAQEEARARRRKQEAEEEAKNKAREQAALEVARIQAEGKARLDRENAERAHELEVLKVNTLSGRRRLQVALAAVLSLSVLGGGAFAFLTSQRMTAMEQSNTELRETQSALAKERDQAKVAELAALDRRFAALMTHPLLKEEAKALGEARSTAEAARRAIDGQTLDHSRLRALGEAIDALESRITVLEKLRALDRRHADLSVWADQRKKADLVKAADKAAERARVMPDESGLIAYERALDELRDGLGQSVGGRRPGQTQTTGNLVTGSCLDPHDPMCGFNGQKL